jgi:uncharacterized iron-regulated protein
MRLLSLLLLAALALLPGCASLRAAPEVPGGDMPYRPAEAPKDNEIYHLPTGLMLDYPRMMDILAGARLVCVGETHDNRNAQRVELAVLKGMHERYPGKVALGMEMFRPGQQEALDNWVRGGYGSEADFLKAAKWFAGWGYDFGYYREILEFARDNRIDVIALNPPKDLEDAVSRWGIDALPEETRARLPALGEVDPIQKGVMKGIYGGHLPSEGMFDSFFRIQMLWEEHMAEAVVAYLRSPRGEGKRVVTVTGGWHVKYGFGLPKKVVRRLPLPYATVLPEDLTPMSEKLPGQTMEVELPPVPLVPADFYWMVSFETLEGRQVRLGVQIRTSDGAVEVESVVPLSPAEKGGVRKGDRIVSLDGEPVRDLEDVFYRVGSRKEGDVVKVAVRRGEEELVLPVTLRPLEHGKKGGSTP